MNEEEEEEVQLFFFFGYLEFDQNLWILRYVLDNKIPPLASLHKAQNVIMVSRC
jgi:hypothetical protein